MSQSCKSRKQTRNFMQSRIMYELLNVITNFQS